MDALMIFLKKSDMTDHKAFYINMEGYVAKSVMDEAGVKKYCNVVCSADGGGSVGDASYNITYTSVSNAFYPLWSWIRTNFPDANLSTYDLVLQYGLVNLTACSGHINIILPALYFGTTNPNRTLYVKIDENGISTSGTSETGYTAVTSTTDPYDGDNNINISYGDHVTLNLKYLHLEVYNSRFSNRSFVANDSVPKLDADAEYALQIDKNFEGEGNTYGPFIFLHCKSSLNMNIIQEMIDYLKSFDYKDPDMIEKVEEIEDEIDDLTEDVDKVLGTVRNRFVSR